MLIRILVVALLALVVAWLAAHAIGARRWAAITRDIRAALDAARLPQPPATVDFSTLDALPPPVQRYLRQVLRDGQPLLRRVRLEHRGTFDLGSDRPLWRPFDSRQEVQVRRPGFDWNASVHVAPGVPIRVHDAYAGGTGWLRASLFGLVDVADLSGGGATAQGQLMRWLAETPWYPTALLPGQGVQWRAIDDVSAEATITDGNVQATVVFLFGADGRVSGIRAPARPRTVGGALVPTPWEGRFWNYTERAGMQVPSEGEVAWRLDGEPRAYWRGRMVDIAYE